MTVDQERWIVVPGSDMRDRKTTHQIEGVRKSLKTIDLDTGEYLHNTIVIHVPGEFARAWRENRP